MASNITELKKTVFLTPVVSTVFRYLSLVCMKLIGWRVVGGKPEHPKVIVVAAPHTSNWDFILFVFTAFILRLDIHWMGKDALFPWLFRRLMVWLGGIPIDRSKANNVVDQMATYFASVDRLMVLIPPEGTRKKVEQWKTGFYRIAEEAKVPIVLGFIDAGTKTVGFGPDFIRTDDIDADMIAIQSFYKKMIGINPRNT